VIIQDEVQRRLVLLKRKRAILKARDDLLDFAAYMMPSPDADDDATVTLYERAKHHRVIAAALEEVEAGRIQRLIITVPPRHGKTLLASRMFPAWYIGRHPEHHAIFSTYSEKFAWDGGRAVRDLMDSPLYRQVFPGVNLKEGAASVDRVEVEQGGVLFFLGRRGGTTGRGGHIILIDDPIKDRMEADSPTIRERIWTFYTQVLQYRLMNEGGRIVLIMTRWHEDDLVGRLIDPVNSFYSVKEAKNWSVIHLPAIAGDNDILKREPGEALWPQRFGATYLDRIRAPDIRGFEAQYQGNPTPAEGNFFNLSTFKTYARMSDLPDRARMRFYAASDHAVSTAQNRDKTCLVVVGVDEHGTVWVQPDVYWMRSETDKVVEAMLNLMGKYKPIYWWAEKGHISKSIGPFLRRRMLERGIFCAIDEITPVGDKQQRAQSIHGRLAMGQIRFPSFPSWWAEAQDQLLKFPAATHDDFVDALAYIGLGLSKQTTPRKKAPELLLPAVGSIEWVKGESAKEERRRRQNSSGGW
jgi:predicted phage terminase large subunit-like protein